MSTPIGRESSSGDRPRRRDGVDPEDQEAQRRLHGEPDVAHVRKLFNWAALQPKMLKATPIVRGIRKGEKARERVLSDDELRMIWNAADTLPPTPFKQYVRLLMLTGQRVGEIKALEWTEINKADGLIEFSGAKYKNGRPHIVPMSPMVAQIVATLPKFEKCRFAVTTNGKTAIDCDSHLKDLLDEAIVAADSKALAEIRAPARHPANCSDQSLQAWDPVRHRRACHGTRHRWRPRRLRSPQLQR